MALPFVTSLRVAIQNRHEEKAAQKHCALCFYSIGSESTHPDDPFICAKQPEQNVRAVPLQECRPEVWPCDPRKATSQRAPLCVEDERPRSHLTATRDSAFLFIFCFAGSLLPRPQGCRLSSGRPPINILIHLRQPPVA